MSGVCAWCQRPDSVRAGRRYCSLACSGMARRAPLRCCEQCSGLFPPHDRNSRYCSDACRQASRRIPKTVLTCEHCTKAFTVPPSQSSQRFCSLTCKGLASRHEAHPDRTCAVCGAALSRRRGPRRLESNTQYADRRTCSVECGVILATRNRARPWYVGPRTLLARTCNDCGLLMPRSSFPRGGGGERGHVCHSCVTLSLTPQQRQARAVWADRQLQQKQDATRDTARRHGQHWTGAELEIALREDISTMEAAVMLGRTYAATCAAKAKARHDPKWRQVAGL